MPCPLSPSVSPLLTPGLCHAAVSCPVSIPFTAPVLTLSTVALCRDLCRSVSLGCDSLSSRSVAAAPEPAGAAMAAVQTPETEALLESGADRPLRETEALLAESAGEESDSGDGESGGSRE